MIYYFVRFGYFIEYLVMEVSYRIKDHRKASLENSLQRPSDGLLFGNSKEFQEGNHYMFDQLSKLCDNHSGTDFPLSDNSSITTINKLIDQYLFIVFNKIFS